MRKFYFLSLICIFEILSLIFNFPLHAQTQQNVSVSVTVAPKTTDFQFSYASTDGLTIVNQNTVLSYEITYGANSSAGLSTNTVLEADFSDDLAPDNSHVLDYVPGSASTGYGGAVPVVDLTNRKITWTIPNLPHSTNNQTVTFQLKTNNNYKGATTVNFTTRAAMSNQYISMPDETVTQQYVFDQSLETTPTPNPVVPTSGIVTNPTSNPVVSTAPGLSPQPTRTPSAQLTPRIISIDFTNISNSSVVISITTSTPTKSTISYGINPSQLSQTKENGNYAIQSNITLDNLNSDTTYYFRVVSTDKNGQTIKSEIFTFRTAKKSDSFTITEGALTIESMGRILFSKIIDNSSVPGFVLITEDTDFTLNYIPKNPISYKSFEVIVKSKAGVEKTINNLSQKNTSLYTAFLQTANPGQYEIFLKVIDDKGNLTEQKVADLKVIQKLSVIEKGSNKPLGDARIFLYYFNSRTGKFEPLSKKIFGNIKNPLFTDLDGRVNLILPNGRYRAEASAFLYDKTSQDFTLGPGEGEEFPQLQLNKNPFNFLNILQFIKDWFSDFLLQISGFMYSSIDNIRIFNTLAIIVTVASTLISLLFFLFRTHISAKHLPLFFMFGLHMALNKHVGKYIFGVIKDKNNFPVTRAIIQLIDDKTGEILGHTTSNKNGRFHLQNTRSQQMLKLVIDKDGFKETESVLGIADMRPEGLEIKLETGKESRSLGVGGLRLIEHIGGSMFETALVLSIIAEVFFLYNFGIVRTLPFLVLSLFNTTLWIFFLRESKA